MMNNSTLDAPYRVLWRNEFVEVREDTRTAHKSLFATRPFAPDVVLCSFSARETFAEASRLTIQIGIDKHITLQPEFLQYTNHSCSPNIFFDTAVMTILSLKEIKPGDELKFFYPSTEWEMAQPFACHCGASNCLRYIKGAADLAIEGLRQHRLTEFIYQQIMHHQAERRTANQPVAT